MDGNVYTSVLSITFRQYAYKHIIEVVGKTAIKNIEWSSNIHAPFDNTEKLRSIRGEMEDNGLTTNSYASYYRIGKNDRAEFSKIVAAAKMLGAGNIRIWGTFTAGMEFRGREEYFAAVRDELNWIVEFAADEGMKISIEPHKKSYICDASDIVYIAENLSPRALQWLSFYWQPDVGRRAEENRDDLINILPYLSDIHVNNVGEIEKYSLEERVDDWKLYFEAVQPVFRTVKKKRALILEFTKSDSDEDFYNDAKLLCELAETYF